MYGYDLEKLRPQHMARWLSAPFSTEIWLQHTLRAGHPWRVSRIADADLIFVAANLSTACAINKAYTAQNVWNELMREPLWAATAPPKAISWQFYQECGPMTGSDLAWKAPGIANNTLVFIDQLDAAGGPMSIKAWTHIVTPFAITEPTWLISGSLPFAVPPWAKRKLLFFGGHVPKPVRRLSGHASPTTHAVSDSPCARTQTVDTTRYKLWRALRRDSRATVQSHTIGCNYGAHMRICVVYVLTCTTLYVCSRWSVMRSAWSNHCRTTYYCVPDNPIRM